MNETFARDLATHTDQWHDDPDHDGVQWRLDVEADHDTSINDFECYGMTAWSKNNEYGPVRPFEAGDNAPHARILSQDRGGYYGTALWWWPLPEMWGTPKPYVNGTFDDDFAAVKRLYEDGFAIAHLRRRTSCDCCHQSVDQSAVLGGIDVWPYDDRDYWVSVVTDLADEIGED